MANNAIHAGTIFITGISASGKSTLGKGLEENLRESGINNLRLFDGEDVREELAKQGKTYGYSKEERREVSLHMAHMAAEYNRKGFICIICSICHVRELRLQMRAIIGNVFEVYLDCPVNICAKRDRKGQYTKALEGQCDNFIGVTEPYQKSEQVELILHTGVNSIKECSDQLLETALAFLSGERKTFGQFKDIAELDNKAV